jgi:hypothetical protein
MCTMHASRVDRYGDVNRGRVAYQAPEDRFWPKVNKTPTCWLWTGALNSHGYGNFFDGQRVVGAHRWLYIQTSGAVGDGLDLDHLCRTPACVNPAHLEPVTRKVNLRRGVRGGGQHPWRTA